MAFQTPSTLGVVHSPIEYSESVRPAGKYRAAPWLPVKVFDNRANEYVVMYSGCPVAGAAAVDATGKAAGFTDLFPASLIEQVGNVITWTQADVDVGTIDPNTGVLAVAGANVTGAQLRTYYGLAAFGSRQDFPIGVLSYNAFRFPGSDGSNPNGYTFTNFAFQDQLTITCDYILEVPVASAVTATSSTTAGADYAANAAINITALVNPAFSATTFPTGSFSVTLNGTDVTTGAVLTEGAPDTISVDVPVFTGDVIVVTYVQTAASVAGSYNNRLLTGTPIFLSDEVAATYNQAVLPAVGSYVKAGITEGSFTSWIEGTDVEATIVGQIISADRTLNRGALDKVRTQYQSGALNTTRLGLNQALYQQPGSATSGKPGNVHRALGTEYAGVIRINLLK